jgi:hypothetical protein
MLYWIPFISIEKFSILKILGQGDGIERWPNDEVVENLGLTNISPEKKER